MEIDQSTEDYSQEKRFKIDLIVWKFLEIQEKQEAEIQV